MGGANTLPGPGASLGKLLKMMRMARVMRLLRMIRFLSHIRVMVTMIIGSLRSLFWLFVLLAGIIYVFALLLTRGAADCLLESTEDEGTKAGRLLFTPTFSSVEYLDDVTKSYGGILRSMYTLFLG